MIVVGPPKPRPSLFATGAKMIVTLGALLFLVAMCSNLSMQPETGRTPTIVPPAAHDALNLSDFRAASSAGLITIGGRIENSADEARRDVRISCDQNGGSGTVIRSREAILYETIPAKGRKDFRGLDMGLADSQMRTVTCRIVGARY
jgi:hypothetical protein